MQINEANLIWSALHRIRLETIDKYIILVGIILMCSYWTFVQLADVDFTLIGECLIVSEVHLQYMNSNDLDISKPSLCSLAALRAFLLSKLFRPKLFFLKFPTLNYILHVSELLARRENRFLRSFYLHHKHELIQLIN